MINKQIIRQMPNSTTIGLRRSFGKNVDEISMNNAVAFYSIAPDIMTKREEQNLFFAVTMYCYYRENADDGKPFAIAVSDYYKKCSESGRRSLESMIDATYDLRGTFFQRLYSLVKKMESEGIYIDAEDMYRELQFWDSKGKERKRRIAKNIVHAEEDTK